MVTGAITKLNSAKSKKMWEKKKGQLGAHLSQAQKTKGMTDIFLPIVDRKGPKMKRQIMGPKMQRKQTLM